MKYYLLSYVNTNTNVMGLLRRNTESVIGDYTTNKMVTTTVAVNNLVSKGS
jgi:hypothetical protein